MTRQQLREQMPNNEYHMWRAYLTWKASMQELHAQEIVQPSHRRGR